MNVGLIAAIEFEDGPDRGAHLLALHVSGVTGHTQSAKSDQGRDDASYWLAPRVALSSGTKPILLPTRFVSIRLGLR